MEKKFSVKRLTSYKDFYEAQKVQKNTWGLSDLDIIPVHLLIALKPYSELFGVYSSDNSMIGVAFAFPTARENVMIFHLIGIIPAFRKTFAFYTLVRALMDSLRKKGVDYLTWTYDILDFNNAKIYHNKFEAVGYRIIKNYYGELNSSRHGNLPTHRLLCFKSLNNKLEYYETRELKVKYNLEELLTMGKEKAALIYHEYYDEFSKILAEGYLVTGIKNDIFIFNKTNLDFALLMPILFE